MIRFLTILISILFISVYLFDYSNKNMTEYFNIGTGTSSNIEYTNYESDYIPDRNSETKYYTQLDYKPVAKINCCLVEEKYLPDPLNELGGSFKYKFTPLKDTQCNLKNHRLDNTAQLFIDGYNGWSNESCKEPNNTQAILGSCRNINKECIDFVTNEFCTKYKMTWSPTTCKDPMKYKWVDRTAFTKPIPTNDGTFIMFNKESELAKYMGQQNKTL